MPREFRPPTDEQRCTANTRKGTRCPKFRVKGATVCLSHGAKAPQVRAAAERRDQEQQARELAKRSVVDLSRYADPVAGLEYAVSASYALAERLTQIAGGIPDSELVWRNKTGEHLRGEVVAAQRALSDLRAASDAALRIGIDARRAGITQQTLDMLDRALGAALNASGVGFDAQARAREIFRKNIVVRNEPA